MILVALLAAALLGVGIYLQRTEQVPEQAAPVRPTVGATSTVPTVTATVIPPGAEARDPATPPSGYAQSCASAYPWGQRVSKPFVCIDTPKTGATVPTSIQLRGYAGATTEHTLMVSLVAEQVDGTRTPVAGDLRVPVTYTPPGAGMPGLWIFSITLGGLAPEQGTVHIEVFGEASGVRLMETKLDLTLKP